MRYHSDTDSFYDADNNLYPEPPYTMDELEKMIADAVNKLKMLPENGDFNIGLVRFNLCSYIENLEWKIDLKLLHMENK